MEPENPQDNFDLKFSKLEVDLSPPTWGHHRRRGGEQSLEGRWAEGRRTATGGVEDSD